jgi:hypothetical protein
MRVTKAKGLNTVEIFGMAAELGCRAETRRAAPRGDKAALKGNKT